MVSAAQKLSMIVVLAQTLQEQWPQTRKTVLSSRPSKNVFRSSENKNDTKMA
jgi:hypothetical protein